MQEGSNNLKHMTMFKIDNINILDPESPIKQDRPFDSHLKIQNRKRLFNRVNSSLKIAS